MWVKIIVIFCFTVVAHVATELEHHDFYDMERYRTSSLSAGRLALRGPSRRRDEGRLRGSNDAVHFVRENRAIETTLKNVVVRGEPIAGDLDQVKVNRFPWGVSSFHNTDEALEPEKLPEYFDGHQNEEAGQEQETDPAELLEELKSAIRNEGSSFRQGRRKKLTSQEQGTLLVEALKKRRNYTSNDDDPRGQSSSVQNSIMDILERSTRRISSCLIEFDFFSLHSLSLFDLRIIF